MMADDTFFEELETGTRRGQTLLDKLLFAEAEAVYRQVLRQCDPSGGLHHDTERHRCAIERATVTSVTGLAEIYSRQSRSVTTSEDVTHWMRLMVQSLSLHREAAELCRRALHRRADSSQAHNDIKFFEDAASLSTSRAKLIEDALVSTVKSQLTQKNVTSRASYQQQMKSSTSSEWLHNVLSRCSESSTGTDYDEVQTDTTGSLSSSSSSSLVSTEWNSPHGLPADDVPPSTETTPRVRRRRINFDRIQSAIKQLVSEASSEVRSQYGHLVTTGSVTQSLLQRRVTSELMVRLARTGKQGTELKDLLQDSITYEEEWQENTNEPEVAPGSVLAKSSSPLPLNGDDFDDSDSNADDVDNNYETIYVECPAATTIERLGHVIIKPHYGNKLTSPGCTAVTRDVAGVGSTSVSGTSAEPEVSRSSNRVTLLGLNTFGQREADGIITVWKSYGSVDEEEHLEQQGQQQQQPVTSLPPPSHTTRASLLKLPSFEEVSALTERDRVYQWLDETTAVDDVTLQSQPQSAAAATADRRFSADSVATTAAGNLSPSKLSQTVGLVSLQVADQLREDSRYREAFDVYKYALGIFQDHPPVCSEDDIERRKLVAGLLRDIGIVKCNLGDMAAGCQLMEESATLYEWSKTQTDLNKVAEVWYSLGNMFLTDDLRQNSLVDHMMRMTQKSLKETTDEDVDSDDDDNGDKDDVDLCRDDDNEDSYSVCTHEAIVCYQRALNLLNRYHKTLSREMTAELAELYAGTLSKLADCYVLTSQLDRAVVHYERTLPYFHLAAVGGPMDRRLELLALNAHVLSQLGTVNYLLRNYWRAAAIYETSMMLRHQLSATEQTALVSSSNPSGSLEAAWLYTMYGMTCGTLGRDHQCIVWCLRAFAGYVAVLRGRILDVEPLRRWFVVETLYALGRAYGVIEDGAAKAVHYLTVAKNLACAAPDDQLDYPQTIEVLDSLAEACEAIGDSDGAQRYQIEATELASTYYQDKPPLTVASIQSETQPPRQPDPSPDEVPETAIREGVESIISQLGMKKTESSDWTRGEVTVDATSIRTAERELQEAVCKAGGAAVIALATNSVYAQPNRFGERRNGSISPQHSLQTPTPTEASSPSILETSRHLSTSPLPVLTPSRLSPSSPTTTLVNGTHNINNNNRLPSPTTLKSRDLTEPSQSSFISTQQQQSVGAKRPDVLSTRVDTNKIQPVNGRQTLQSPGSANGHITLTSTSIRSPTENAPRTGQNITVTSNGRQINGDELNGHHTPSTVSPTQAKHVEPIRMQGKTTPTPTAEFKSPDEWVTVEEVVETPADLLSMILNKKRFL